MIYLTCMVVLTFALPKENMGLILVLPFFNTRIVPSSLTVATLGLDEYQPMGSSSIPDT